MCWDEKIETSAQHRNQVIRLFKLSLMVIISLCTLINSKYIRNKYRILFFKSNVYKLNCRIDVNINQNENTEFYHITNNTTIHLER